MFGKFILIFCSVLITLSGPVEAQTPVEKYKLRDGRFMFKYIDNDYKEFIGGKWENISSNKIRVEINKKRLESMHKTSDLDIDYYYIDVHILNNGKIKGKIREEYKINMCRGATTNCSLFSATLRGWFRSTNRCCKGSMR